MAKAMGPVGGPNKKRFEERERRMKKAMGDEDLIEKESYEDDFGTEAEIIELKDKKKELQKDLKGKSEKEKKSILEKIEEIVEKILDLENK